MEDKVNIDRLEDFQKLWEDFSDEESDYLITKNLGLMEFLAKGFFDAPASTKYHGAYEGGLYDHSRQVYLRLKELTENNHLEWLRVESPFIIGMFHDLCKYDQYKFIPNEYEGEQGHYEYNNNTLLKGHGSKSVILLSQFINLTEEEMLCIRYHMGAYEKEEWAEYDMAIRKYPNVLWTHHADMIASKVDNL